jgi:hypothetical protein
MLSPVQRQRRGPKPAQANGLGEYGIDPLNRRKSMAVIMPRRGNRFSFSLGGEGRDEGGLFFPHTILRFMGEGGLPTSPPSVCANTTKRSTDPFTAAAATKSSSYR